MPLRMLMLLLVAVLLAPGAARAAGRPEYGVLFTAWIDAGKPVATVRMRLTRNPGWVRWMRLQADPARYTRFKGTGQIRVEGGVVHWVPPAEDAWLQFRVDLRSTRASGRLDGHVTPDWALFRADDLVPPVRIDMLDGTQSKSKLDLKLPPGWSVATHYPRYASGRINLDNPARLFDRPIGWLLVGKFGARRERIGDTRVTVAAPPDNGVRRMDILAFLRWTVPEMQDLFPAFPERLLVVSAGDPMWRGALSGPNSLFVHADRPMISENGTSTLVHELVHVGMRARSTPGADWIVEGLAEYYSLEILRRSGALSAARFERSHQRLEAWGAREGGPLDAGHSSGATTAKAVGVLRAIDREMRRGGKGSLDDVVRLMAAEGEAVRAGRFRELVEQVAGQRVAVFDRLP